MAPDNSSIQKEIVHLNCSNILQWIFSQINAALVSIRDFFQEY